MFLLLLLLLSLHYNYYFLNLFSPIISIIINNIIGSISHRADPDGRAVEGVGLRPLAYWDCRFESRRVHGSLVDVSFCKVEDSASV